MQEKKVTKTTTPEVKAEVKEAAKAVEKAATQYMQPKSMQSLFLSYIRISMISIKQYFAVTAKAKVLKNSSIAYCFRKKTCRMLNWSPTAKQSF